MSEQKEVLTKKITALQDQLGKAKAAGKDLKKDADLRQARKTLKRAQRRLALLTPLTLEQRQARVAKISDMLAKRISDLTQGQKKIQGNPYVRSLRKKTKSANKAKKKLDRVAKKIAAKAAAMAAKAAKSAAPAPAPVTAPAPEAEKK